MSEQLSSRGVIFERIAAVDGNDLGTADHRSIGRWLLAGGRHLTKGEIGCYLSHWKAWSAIVERKLPFAIVLEDDCVMDDALGNWELSPQRFDLDLLRLHIHSADRKKNCLRPWGEAGRYKIFRPMGPVRSTAAYIVSLPGAMRLIALNEVIHPLDHFTWLGLRSGLKHGVVQPNLIGISGLQSTIGKRGEKTRIQRLIKRLVCGRLATVTDRLLLLNEPAPSYADGIQVP